MFEVYVFKGLKRELAGYISTSVSEKNNLTLNFIPKLISIPFAGDKEPAFCGQGDLPHFP